MFRETKKQYRRAMFFLTGSPMLAHHAKAIAIHRQPLALAISALILSGVISAEVAAQAFSASLNLSSLDGANGFRLTGAAASDRAGRAVSAAGDVNGDGFGDLIIGAFGASNNGSYSGSSYVVFGKSSPFSANIALSSLNGSNGFRLDGAAVGDRAGFSVSAAGDVNGDGRGDLIIGAHFADPNGNYSGSIYVLFGKSAPFAASVALSSLDGTNGFRLDGASADASAGISVSAAGDVNGDGVGDLIVGAYGVAANGNDSGSSYVIFGKRTPFASSLALSSLNGGNGFRLSGVAEGDRSGYSVAAAADVNGDGFGDLIVGALRADPNGLESGCSYVVFGKNTPFSANLNLSSLSGVNGFRLDGASADVQSGNSVSSAGDINGDGFDDLLIGAHFADPNGDDSGSSYVVFGKSTPFSATLALSGLNGASGFRLDGVAAYDQSGETVSTAGDINGDGIDDLIVGAPGASPNGSNSGSSYVVFGKRSPFAASLALSSLTGSNGFRLDGGLAGDNSGRWVSAAGDVNGDGKGDLIIGAFAADPNGDYSGSSYVVFGRDAGSIFKNGFE